MNDTVSLVYYIRTYDIVFWNIFKTYHKLYIINMKKKIYERRDDYEPIRYNQK